MKSRVRAILIVFVAVLAGGIVWWKYGRPPGVSPDSDRRAEIRDSAGQRRSSVHPSSTKLAALAASVAPDAISPIADNLGATSGSAQRDVQILNAVFEAWRTNFPLLGNPVGENEEITAALCGDNTLRYAFISPRNPAINAAGQLCDRWQTPYRFHQLSGTQMEIWSAGPDRRFGTADDVRFTPPGVTPVPR